MTGLSGDKLVSLQFKFAHLKLLVVDEVSMLGRNLYKMMDRRPRQIMCRNELFGGLHMVFGGDFSQSASVMDAELFSSEIASTNTWGKRVQDFELTGLMRQKGDREFAAALN